MAIDVFLKFEYLNPRTNAWHAYPAGVEVVVRDSDFFPSGSPNLESSVTDGDGKAHLVISDSTAARADPGGRPDLYFLIRPGNRSVNGVPLPQSWSSYFHTDTAGRRGYYANFAGNRIGSPQSPVTFRIPGLNAWLEFYYYNEIHKKALPVPPGVLAQMWDYDPGTNDELLATSVTGNQGAVSFTYHKGSVPQEAYEGNPEIYFSIHTQGLNDNGVPLPPSQHTRNLRSHYGGSGYYPSFSGSEIGQFQSPRRFVLGPKHFIRVGFILLTHENTDTDTPAFAAKVAKIRALQEKYKEEYLYATWGRSLVVGAQDVAVIKVSGPIPDSDHAHDFLKQVTQKYYETHGDLYDYFAVYEDFGDASLGSRHYTIRNNIEHIGMAIKNDSQLYGSNGLLKGIGLISDVNDLPADYHFSDSRMHLLLHETVGHQYGIYGLSSLQISGSIHFNHYCGGPTFSYLYAHPWRMTPNGKFYVVKPTSDELQNGFFVRFHPIVMYAMGLFEPNEVPVTMVVSTNYQIQHRYDGPDQATPTDGSAAFHNIQDIMDEWGGPRNVL